MPPAVKNQGQRPGVEPGCQGRRHGDAHMQERPHQDEVEDQVGGHRYDTDLDRRRRVLAGEKSGGQGLDQHIGRQAHGVNGQRLGGGDGLRGAEGATFKQHDNDGMGDDHQGHRRRQGEQKDQFQGPVLAVGGGLGLAGAKLAGKQGQQRRADGDADDPQGQLVHPVGKEQVGNGPGRQQGGDHRIDQQADLIDAGAHHHRRHAPQQKANVGAEPWPPGAKHNAGADAVNVKPRQLHHAGPGNPPGQGVTGAFQHRRQQQDGADQAQVEQNGRGGGGGEAPQGIEHPGHQRYQGNEQQVGKGDPGQGHRQIELFRIIDKAGGESDHGPRHGQFDDDDEDQQGPHQDAERLFGEGVGLFLVAVFHQAGVNGHEGQVERPFGEQAAKQVGKLEGDKKGIGHGTGAEDGGDQYVPDEPQEAADHGGAANGGDGTQKNHGFCLKVF